MKNYIVFDSSTGEVLRAGHCQDSDLALQDPNGNVLESDADESTGFVQDGQVVLYTGEQAAAKAAVPAYPARWSNETFAWQDLRDLDAIKRDQWSKVKAARDAAIRGSFTWDGSVFDSNETSQRQIQGAVQLAQLAGTGFSIDWTLQDNSVRTLTSTEMIQVGIALGTWVQTNFTKGISLREQINAATDAASVQAVTWA